MIAGTQPICIPGCYSNAISIHPMKFQGIALSVPVIRFEIDFQDSSHGDHLGFLNITILAIFDIQVNPILPINRVSWPFRRSSKQIVKMAAVVAILNFGS